MRMGNQQSQVGEREPLHAYNTRGSSSRSRSQAATTTSSTTVLPDRTISSIRNESGMDLDPKVKAESWISETGSELSGTPPRTEKSTPCPTELPPPPTMEAAQKQLTRLNTLIRQRDLELQGLITGLGGVCGIWISAHYDSGCDGNLVYELKMTQYEFRDLGTALPCGDFYGNDDEEPLVWSQKLLGDIFAVLDGYGRVLEDIVELCGKLREVQTGDRLPEASDLEWLKENITPDAVKFAARLQHLTSRSQVVRFDIDREISRMTSGV